ncbi:hypothetical protein [Streptomyces sp. NPDC001714]|uniref:hypothetical protein n=1 Tax=Streptomyces sp. NPDC001714 TaxID=3364603 RepID=UPI00368427C3
MLERDVADHDSLMSVLRQRGADPLDRSDRRALDRAELDRGAARPRAEFVTVQDMLSALTRRRASAMP